MREYIFIDEKRLSSLTHQIPASGRNKKQIKKNVSLSVLGPQVSLTEEADNSQRNPHEEIEKLISELDKNKLLSYRRPIRHPDPDEDRPFVLEETEACRLILPKSAIAHTPGIQDFAVWVSDPAAEELSTELYEWTGSFLFLTEMWLDDQYGGHFWSGCSALQLIGNAIAGKQLLELAFHESEPLGRGSYLHPVRKLISIGARMTNCMTHKIVTLYLKRYLTDEQCFELRGTNYRTNDLLGYPIFIARRF